MAYITKPAPAINGANLEHQVCSICEAEYSGPSHNAWPLTGRCCESCNEGAVFPARMFLLSKFKALFPPVESQSAR